MYKKVAHPAKPNKLGDTPFAEKTTGPLASLRLIALTALVMALVFALVFDARVDISLDEGIYLHGSQRILAGQALYRDFFALTGPRTFWLYAL